jgi:hypothetical protein
MFISLSVDDLEARLYQLAREAKLSLLDADYVLFHDVNAGGLSCADQLRQLAGRLVSVLWHSASTFNLLAAWNTQ